MSFTRLTGHLAYIEEPEKGADRFGQQPNKWHQRGSAIPCRASQPTGSELKSVETRDLVQSTVTIFFSPDVDISEDYRIRKVTDPDGIIIHQNLDVQFVRRVTGFNSKVHHLEVSCLVARGAMTWLAT